MPLLDSDYRKPLVYFNAHVETILPALFRRVKGLFYEREVLELKDGDFIDLDWLKNSGSRQLVILTHGLEGDTQRAYIRGMAKIFYSQGWNVLAWNHRGCSGRLNRLPRFYHSGASEDLRSVVGHAQNSGCFDRVVLIGFSLGGNMTLKYLGEEGGKLSPLIEKAIVFSVPLHLSSCSKKLSRPSNLVYSQKFLQSLKHKIRLKARKMPDKIPLDPLKKVKTLKDFDDHYTAPLSGFADAEDYYQQSSSLFFVERIQLPTLVVNAQNDPFLSPESYPFELIGQLETVWLETPDKGGHCGFTLLGRKFYWSELRAWQFVNEMSGDLIQK